MRREALNFSPFSHWEGGWGIIPFHVNSDTYKFCRDAKFRVSTGMYLYQGFCETVLGLLNVVHSMEKRYTNRVN
ncbi:hypothetical protein NIES4075_49500 [Tolypothrix sp. NIES-4075]|nr:hypothetical protein NIES4075_49500 [Tolypothrix sp. NIES-4075]